MITKSASVSFLRGMAVAACFLLATPFASAQDTGRFLQVTEGLLDTETGIVWGHLLDDAEAFTSGPATTAGWTWDRTVAMTLYADSDGDGVIDGQVTYQDFSNTLYDRNDTDWRIPTRTELVDAVRAGLMFHLDISPEPGLQLFDPATRSADVWSSTYAGKKRGFDSWYMVDLVVGDSANYYQSLIQLGSIPVRGVPAPADEPTGGKGNRGGKK